MRLDVIVRTVYLPKHEFWQSFILQMVLDENAGDQWIHKYLSIANLP